MKRTVLFCFLEYKQYNSGLTIYFMREKTKLSSLSVEEFYLLDKSHSSPIYFLDCLPKLGNSNLKAPKP